MAMNYSTAIFLVNNKVRAVALSYDKDSEGKGIKPFIIFKTMDPGIKAKDLVIIPTETRHNMTVARVEEVDLEVDLESAVQMHWLIDTVDDAAFQLILHQEKQAIERIKSAEVRAKRDELRAKLIADNPDLAALGGINPVASPALSAPLAYEDVPEAPPSGDDKIEF